jgi:hypothetical protein
MKMKKTVAKRRGNRHQRSTVRGKVGGVRKPRGRTLYDEAIVDDSSC